MTGDETRNRVTSRELIAVFGRIGLLSFGGPAAQIALMHRELVEERPWMRERAFLSALSFCMLLPGPEAMQLATFCGWKLRGIWGGLVAGLLFVLPGAVVIALLALLYAVFGDMPLSRALFLGIKAAIVIVVINALLGLARKALTAPHLWVLAGAAFVSIFFLGLPFPLIILGAAVYGFGAARGERATAEGGPLRPDWREAGVTLVLWAGLWAAPLLIAAALGQSFLLEIGLFFSKLALVTFGGAYALLAYVAQDVVQVYGWLAPGEMMDGLGLAETTPGPLILVTEFVGFLAGWKAGGAGLALLSALMTLWVTFVPCFLWIFLGAPYVAWITSQPRMAGALSAITAAVVGVILNLSLWFALHVFFGELRLVEHGPFQLWQPELGSLDGRAVLLAAIAAVHLFILRRGLLEVLAVAALGGVLLSG